MDDDTLPRDFNSAVFGDAKDTALKEAESAEQAAINEAVPVIDDIIEVIDEECDKLIDIRQVNVKRSNALVARDLAARRLAVDILKPIISSLEVLKQKYA